MLFGEMGAKIIEKGAKARAFMRFGHGTRDELRLAAITMGGHDEPPRDKVGAAAEP